MITLSITIPSEDIQGNVTADTFLMAAAQLIFELQIKFDIQDRWPDLFLALLKLSEGETNIYSHHDFSCFDEQFTLKLQELQENG